MTLRVRSPRAAKAFQRRAAFTLIELLVAAALAALIMMTAIPYAREVRKSPLVRAVNGLVEACRQARLKAILTDRPMQVVFLEGGRIIGVQPVPTFRRAFAETQPTPTVETETEPALAAGSVESETILDDSVAFAWLLVNGRGFIANVVDEEALAVRFYPNGTSDALDAKLQDENRNGQRIVLDIMTGQPTVEAAH